MSEEPKATVRAKIATDMDKDIGVRLFKLRKLRKLSCKDLATSIGVSHQQLKKYENGVNRICASRLQALADVLGVPVMHFYADNADYGNDSDILKRQVEYLEGLQGFLKIINKDKREAICQMVQLFAQEGEQEALAQPAEEVSVPGKRSRKPSRANIKAA